jgi:ceramide glucosyltransferase
MAFVSLGLALWQARAAWRFPLHQRSADPAYCPPVTVLKPLKGIDANLVVCLRSWFQQDYGGTIQVLFGVASADDPACEAVRQLINEHPGCDAQLVICSQALGANGKMSKLIQLLLHARFDTLVISDADVRVPPDLLANLVVWLRPPDVGLVNCFYRLANPTTLALRWEAVAINADFWSQVLQGMDLWSLDYALGAVMATTRKQLEGIGGFQVMADYLADDYQLGHRIARRGAKVVICPVVVDCWSTPLNWTQVWAHQLRWARTIRCCEPGPYAASIIGNPTLWPLLWLAVRPTMPVMLAFLFCLGVRVFSAISLQRRLTRARVPLRMSWLIPLKDLLQFALWIGAFTGRQVEWGGQRYRIQPGGKLAKC